MKRTEIQLSEPFEQVLASVLTLPSTLAEIEEDRFAGATDLESSQSGNCDVEVKEAVRSLYEAAHGRQVETAIGFLPIAPPIAGFLKEKPYLSRLSMSFSSKRSREFWWEDHRGSKTEQMVRGRAAANCSPAVAE